MTKGRPDLDAVAAQLRTILYVHLACTAVMAAVFLVMSLTR